MILTTYLRTETIKKERLQSQKNIGFHGLDAVLLDVYIFMYSES